MIRNIYIFIFPFNKFKKLDCPYVTGYWYGSWITNSGIKSSWAMNTCDTFIQVVFDCCYWIGIIIRVLPPTHSELVVVTMVFQIPRNTCFIGPLKHVSSNVGQYFVYFDIVPPIPLGARNIQIGVRSWKRVQQFNVVRWCFTM